LSTAVGVDRHPQHGLLGSQIWVLPIRKAKFRGIISR
jgi:hypothetical protein